MHLTISVAVSLRDFYCSLSHGAASVWVFGFGATDSLCPFAISLARHLLSLSRSRFPHWGHVISSGVWMWQENDSVLGSQFSACLCISSGHKEATVATHLFAPLFLRFFFFCSLSCCFCLCWLLLSAQPRTSFALDDAKDYQVVGMWQRPKEEYKLSSMLVGHYAGPNRIRTSAHPHIRLSAYPKYPLPCPFFFFFGARKPSTTSPAGWQLQAQFLCISLFILFVFYSDCSRFWYPFLRLGLEHTQKIYLLRFFKFRKDVEDVWRLKAWLGLLAIKSGTIPSHFVYPKCLTAASRSALDKWVGYSAMPASYL